MPWQSSTYHIKGDTGSIHTGKFRAGDSSVPTTRGLWWDSFIWTEQHLKKYHHTAAITSVIIKCVNTRTKDLISLQISFPYFFPSLSMHPCLPASHSSFHLHFFSYPHSSILSTFYKVFSVHCFISSLHPSTLRHSHLSFSLFSENSPHTNSSSPRGQSGTPLHTCDMFTQVRLSHEKLPGQGGINVEPKRQTELLSVFTNTILDNKSC